MIVAVAGEPVPDSFEDGTAVLLLLPALVTVTLRENVQLPLAASVPQTGSRCRCPRRP